MVLIGPVAILSAAAYMTTASLHRANRLLPGRTAASPPLRWLWSPGSGAMLHRRLRSACQLVGPLADQVPPPRRWRRRSMSPADGLAELAREVVREAVVLDRQVVAASYMARGMPRAQALGALDYQVRAVEDAARRVHQLANRRAQLAQVPAPGALSLDQRISVMEEALGELTPRPPLI